MYWNTKKNITCPLLFLFVPYFLISTAHANLFFSLENDGTLAEKYTIDRDQTSTDYIDLLFGAVSAQLRYEISTTRFVLNQAVRIVANLAVVGQTYVAADHSVSDSDGVLNLGRNGSIWENLTFDATTDNRFELSDSLDVGGTLSASTLNLDTTPPTFSSGARPTRQVTLTPEFAGATFTADGTNNSGVMGSDFCENGVSADLPDTNTGICNTAGDIHNYYTWSLSNQGSAQDYDIWVRWRVPDNFSAWVASDPIKVYAKRTDVTNNAVTIFVYDTAGTLENAGGTQVAGTNWTQTSIEASFAGTYTTGSYMTIRIVLNADIGGDSTQVGEISLDYLSDN